MITTCFLKARKDAALSRLAGHSEFGEHILNFSIGKHIVTIALLRCTMQACPSAPT